MHRVRHVVTLYLIDFVHWSILFTMSHSGVARGALSTNPPLNISTLIEMYKILHGIYDTAVSPVLPICQDSVTRVIILN